MSMKISRITLAVLLLLVTNSARADSPDERLLKDAGVGTDTASLLAFFRQRSPSEVDRRRMEVLVKQLGSERFAQREEASQELARRGPAARGLLRKAKQAADAEVVRRAEHLLDELDRGPGSALPMAAARLLGSRPLPLVREPADHPLAALLGYLPFADDEGVEGEVLDALAAISDRTPSSSQLLLAVLKDAAPERRAAAAHALGRSSEKDRRAAVRPLLSDPEPRVRFRAAAALLVGRERDAVPVLIDLVRDAPAELAWEAEELLVCLASEQAPTEPIGDDTEARRHRRTAWHKWWEGPGARVDLVLHDEPGRLRGLTLVPEMHANKVWECGPDGKPLWTVSNLLCPIDAQVLPGGRILVAELHGNRVTERDLSGKVLWQVQAQTPITCQRLANGHTFFATNHRAVIVNRDGKEVSAYSPGQGFFIHSIQRQRNGHLIMVSMAGVLREVDAAGRTVRSFILPGKNSWSGVEGIPGGRYLAVNNAEGKVVEMDATGKTIWEYTQAGACYASRLPGGTTLVVSNNGGLFEVDRTGRTIWQKPVGSSLWRAHRR